MLSRNDKNESVKDNTEDSSLKKLIKELLKEVRQLKKENTRYRTDTKDPIKFLK